MASERDLSRGGVLGRHSGHVWTPSNVQNRFKWILRYRQRARQFAGMVTYPLSCLARGDILKPFENRNGRESVPMVQAVLFGRVKSDDIPKGNAILPIGICVRVDPKDGTIWRVPEFITLQVREIYQSACIWRIVRNPFHDGTE